MHITVLGFVLVWAQSGHAAYFGSITGQGLIGSHFGIPFFNASFDYVIVGGGTAGLTVAMRLAQNASNTVAVIEAGGFPEFDNGNLTAIPADSGYWIGKSPLERNPLIDWEIYTEPMAVSDLRFHCASIYPLLTGFHRVSGAGRRSTHRVRRWGEEAHAVPWPFIGLT